MIGGFGFGVDASADWTRAALDHYEAGWAAFVERTMFVDMADVRRRFLDLVPGGGRVLDVGAGAGRDVAAFLAAGLRVDALEPCSALARHVRANCGVDVFGIEAGDLEAVRTYDGVWACASLLHLDVPGLDAAVERLVTALRPEGVFYASFKEGDGHRFDADGRHFLDLRLDGLADLCARNGLLVVDVWCTDPVIADQVGRRWCNVIARRVT